MGKNVLLANYIHFPLTMHGSDLFFLLLNHSKLAKKLFYEENDYLLYVL